MHREAMERAVAAARLSAQDRKWFVMWIGWYAKFCRVPEGQPLPVDAVQVIGFLRQQKERGRAAWQRLQAVRAIRGVPRVCGKFKHEPPLSFPRRRESTGL